MSSTYRRLKHVVFGRPLPSERLEHERLNKKTALAVLSSDAISSVAYATDHVRVPEPRPAYGAALLPLHRTARDGQPARRARVWRGVLHSDLPLHRDDA